MVWYQRLCGRRQSAHLEIIGMGEMWRKFAHISIDVVSVLLLVETWVFNVLRTEATHVTHTRIDMSKYLLLMAWLPIEYICSYVFILCMYFISMIK
jgi:hypothetical protein